MTRKPSGGGGRLASASPPRFAGMQVCAHKLHPSACGMRLLCCLWWWAALVFSPKTVLRQT